MRLYDVALVIAATSISWINCNAAPGEIYSSLTYMDSLFLFDRLVGGILVALPRRTGEVDKYIESYAWAALDASRVDGRISHQSITGNPLHIYAVVKRLVLYWPDVRATLNHFVEGETKCSDRSHECSQWSLRGECYHNPTYMLAKCSRSCGLCPQQGLAKEMTLLNEAERETVLPTRRDLRGASLALARLQRVYRIPIWNMAHGRLHNTTCSVRLSAHDFLMIANESFHAGEYANAWQWYRDCQGALSDPDLRIHVKDMLQDVARKHDELHAQGKATVPAFFSRSLLGNPDQLPPDTIYAKLCRGENLLTQQEKAILRCYVSNRGSPYLTLQPVKYEQLHYDPPMFMFYDFIHQSEIEIIKENATSKLHRSLVGTTGESKSSEIRVSHTAWLANSSHPILISIANRISAITGLHVFEGSSESKAGEDLQVLSYGVGGHYLHHLDPLYKFQPEDKWNGTSQNRYLVAGDRMVTVMFYMSDVEAGGRTAFPDAGVSVPPVKRAAIMWYNLKRNGYLNPRSKHGGCPVLLGHKWVANKWIREHANFLRSPCTLDPDQ